MIVCGLYCQIADRQRDIDKFNGIDKVLTRFRVLSGQTIQYSVV